MTSHRSDVCVVSVMPGDRPYWITASPRALLTALALVVVASLASPAEAVSRDPGPFAPSRTASCDAWSSTVTEPVAEGLARVMSDAVGHTFDRGKVREIAIDSDGKTWVAQGRRVIAVDTRGGVEPRSAHRASTPRHLGITPSGALWAIEDNGSVVMHEDGQWLEWTDDTQRAGRSLEAKDVDSLWRVLHMTDGSNQVASLGDTGWEPSSAPELRALLGRNGRYSFASTTDGRTWLGIDRAGRRGDVAVFDGDRWTLDAGLEAMGAPRILGLAAGSDGSLWALGDRESGLVRPADYVLLHHNGVTWTVFGADEGMPRDAVRAWTSWSRVAPFPITVDHDGRVWFSIYGVGLFSFDGDVFRRVGAPGLGLGVLDLDVGADGCVWIATVRGSLQVMDPSVAAAPVIIEPLEVRGLDVVPTYDKGDAHDR